MKIFNKQLLTTGALLLALCGLTSFNPLSHYYSDSGSMSLASGQAPLSTFVNGVRVTADQAQQTADDTNKQAATICARKSLASKKQFSPAQKSECIKAESTKIADANKNDPAPKEAAAAVIAGGSKCPKDLAHRYDVGDSAIRKVDTCPDTQLMQFPIKNGEKNIGTIVIDRIENLSSKNSNEIGEDSSGSKVKVYYRFLTDKDKLTEGGICAQETCMRTLTETKPLVISSLDYDDIKKGLSDVHSSALLTLRSEIASIMGDKRDHLAERVAEREKEGCHKKDYIHDVVCFTDKFKKTGKDTDTYADLVSNFKDFVEKSAKDPSVSPYNLKMGVTKIARISKDPSLEKEVGSMIQEGLQYKSVAVNREADAKRLDFFRVRIETLDRQLNTYIAAGYCSETVTPNVPGVGNNMFGGMNIYQQMNSDPCSGLRSQRTQEVMTMENQIQLVKNQYHSSYFVGKTDPLALSLKEELSSDYSDLVDQYEPYISDPSLLELDGSDSSVLAATRTQQGQWTHIATPSVINRVPVNGQQQIYNPNMPTSLFTNNQQLGQFNNLPPWAANMNKNNFSNRPF